MIIGISGNANLQQLKDNLDAADDNLQAVTKNTLENILNYYSKDGIWLTNDFAEIHAKMNNLNIIIHTGKFNSNGEEQISKFAYGSENSEIIHIGIRDGEKGNHFEKIDNIAPWLEEERTVQENKRNKFANNYSLTSETAENIANEFLKHYESLSILEKRSLCDLIFDEGDANLINATLRSKYSEKYKLPDYLWDGIATELFYELANRSIEFFVQRPISEIGTDFVAIVHANIEAKYTIPSISLINKFANRLNNFSREDLDIFIEANPTLHRSNYTIDNDQKFAAYYGVRLVIQNYTKEFIDTKDQEFWNDYQNKYPAYTDEQEKQRWNQYLIDRREWMKGNFKILDGDNNAIIYQAPDFNKWKNEMVNNLIFSVPGYIVESISAEETKEQNQKITQAQQARIKSLKLDKLAEKDFALLLSYALSDDNTKEFLLEKIKSNIVDEDEQKAFFFKAELISDLIIKDQISPLDIVTYFKIRYETKDNNKNSEDRDLRISYRMKKPTDIIAEEYQANKEDMVIPMRRNPHNLKVIFTELVKGQIAKDNGELEDWRKTAGEGFIGPKGEQGIKLIPIEGKHNLYELKSFKKELSDKRCYVIQEGNKLFVVGYEKQKSQQQSHIEKYLGYEVETVPNKEIARPQVYNLKNLNQENQRIN